MTFIGVSRHKNKIVYFFRKEVGGWLSKLDEWRVTKGKQQPIFWTAELSLSLSSQKTEQFCVFCDMEETNQRQVKTFQNTMRKIEPQSLRIIVVSQL
jgi:hypothetical protein